MHPTPSTEPEVVEYSLMGVRVRAIRWAAGPHQPDGRRSGGNEVAVNDFLPGSRLCFSSDGHPCVATSQGLRRMEPGDWVGQMPSGVFFVMEDEQFTSLASPAEPVAGR